MLYLSFKGATPSEDVVSGPAMGFRVVGKIMHAVGNDDLLASHDNRFWHIGDKCFIRAECAGPASVAFENAAAKVIHGPFRSVSVIDGAVYGDGELLATFVDDAALWHDRRSQTTWPVMIFARPH